MTSSLNSLFKVFSGIRARSIPTLKILLDAGANMNKSDGFQAILQVPERKKCPAMVKSFLDADAQLPHVRHWPQHKVFCKALQEASVKTVGAAETPKLLGLKEPARKEAVERGRELVSGHWEWGECNKCIRG
jgi:hypothetical protein